MRLSTVVSAAGLWASACALPETSPFLLFSTSKLHQSNSGEQLQTSEQVLRSAHGFLSSCPTSRYLLVAQPNLNAAHLRSSTTAPKLQKALGSSKIRWRLNIAEVAGSIDIQKLAEYIQQTCQAKQSIVDQVVLDAIPSTAAAATLQSNDDDLGIVLDQYNLEGSYTIIYTAGEKLDQARDHEVYEPEFEQGYHQELKRQLSFQGKSPRALNGTDNLPLFEKYVFFNPAIFMALTVLFVLLAILWVGVAALGSLQVSYGAFEKENGPAAQKKQQ